MLTQTAEYAVRAMLYLAVHRDSPRTVTEIAAQTHVPANYLSKVLSLLSRAGLVESQRGLHGGSRLAQETEAITLLDILDAVDGRPRGVKACPMGSICSCGRCPVCRLINGTVEEVLRRLGSKTLEDLVREGGCRPRAEAVAARRRPA